MALQEPLALKAMQVGLPSLPNVEKCTSWRPDRHHADTGSVTAVSQVGPTSAAIAEMLRSILEGLRIALWMAT